MNGTVFDIKEFSIHDGPGARITVFLKGCPLRCIWCHNPEGLSPIPQLMHKKSICIGCGKCLQDCSHDECKPYGRCIHACASGALSVSGYEISSDELAERLLSSRDMLDMMKGGITVSGGEPMLQADFVCELFDRLGDMHKAVQTSGYADIETYKRVIDRADYIMQDIKLALEADHKKYTGVSNAQILKNIEYLKASGKPYVLRVPLIPRITDTEENLRGLSRIAGSSPVELLRYNTLAGAKYEMLGMKYTLSDVENRKEAFTSYFNNAKTE